MFVSKYTTQFLVAAFMVVVVSIGCIAAFGIPFGIDFTGGALTEVSYNERPEKSAVEARLTAAGYEGFSLRATTNEEGKDGYILRTSDLSEAERQEVETLLVAEGTGGVLDRYASIGPVIGQELRDKAVYAIGAVVVIIILYVAIAFRRVATPVGSWVYGAITIAALFHDVIVPTALISLLGYFLGAEADVLFVMALLAVLGYSVNDTIVVFDRVREQLKADRTEHTKTIREAGVERTETTYTLNRPFADIVGSAVDQTLLRSINTSLTTTLALLALYLFGGDTTETFALMLIAGVVAGTFSSLCLAPPLLILAERFSNKNAS